MTSLDLHTGPALRPITGAFTLRHADGCHYLFGWTSALLARLSGRALRDHDFLGLWSASDRRVLLLKLNDVLVFGHMDSIRAEAYTLNGEVRDCRFEFSKLDHAHWNGLALGCRWASRSAEALPDAPLAGLRLVQGAGR